MAWRCCDDCGEGRCCETECCGSVADTSTACCDDHSCGGCEDADE